jgi:hypothetical protein
VTYAVIVSASSNKERATTMSKTATNNVIKTKATRQAKPQTREALYDQMVTLGNTRVRAGCVVGYIIEMRDNAYRQQRGVVRVTVLQDYGENNPVSTTYPMQGDDGLAFLEWAGDPMAKQYKLALEGVKE